jgi:TRAP-type mannitol/chloroaromatic compound transport system permease small subunit
VTNTLGHPLPAVFEITEVGVAFAMFLAQPYIAYQSSHIRVDLISFERRWLKVAQSMTILLLSMLGYLIVALGLWRSMSKSIRVSEMSIGLYAFPVWPFKVAVFGCTIVTLAILAFMIVRSVLAGPTPINDTGDH